MTDREKPKCHFAHHKSRLSQGAAISKTKINLNYADTNNSYLSENTMCSH